MKHSCERSCWYVKLKKVCLQTLRKQFELENNEKVAEYFNMITMVTNQMKSYDGVVNDQSDTHSPSNLITLQRQLRKQRIWPS